MIYMPFLYFPEDKSEYIPATIMLVIFVALAVAALYFMLKKNKKDEKKFEEEYQTRLEAAEKIDKTKTSNN